MFSIFISFDGNYRNSKYKRTKNKIGAEKEMIQINRVGYVPTNEENVVKCAFRIMIEEQFDEVLPLCFSHHVSAAELFIELTIGYKISIIKIVFYTILKKCKFVKHEFPFFSLFLQ